MTIGNFEESTMHAEIFPIQPHSETISFTDLSLGLICIAVGTGISTIGFDFNNGWLLSIIASTFFAVTIGFSIYLEFLTFIKTQKGSLELCTMDLIPGMFGRILSIFTLIPHLIGLYICVDYCELSIMAFINTFFDVKNSLFFHPLLIDIAILIFFIIPTTVQSRTRQMVHIIRAKALLILFLLFAVIYIFSQKVMTYGFDPDNKMKVFVSTPKAVASSFSTYLTTYHIQPISMPSLINLEKPTLKKTKYLIVSIMVTQWLIYLVFGLLEYFTLYDINKGDVFFNYFDSPIASVANIALSAIMVLTCSIVMCPIRNVMIHTLIPKSQKRNPLFWSYLAIIIFIVIMFIIRVKTEKTDEIAILILNITSSLLSFSYPSVLYIISFGKNSIIKLIGAVFLTIVGLTLAIHNLVLFLM